MMRRIALMPLAALLASGCQPHNASSPKEQPPPGQVWLTAQQVKDAKLVVSPLTDEDVGSSITTSGRVTFDDLRVSHVFSPVTGRVTKIVAQLGQPVKKGDPLATILSPDVGSAFSDLNKAEANMTAAERDMRRQKELFEAHAASQKDYETSQNNYNQAKAELERARQKARLLRTGGIDQVTQEYTLRSLIDGEVIARAVNPGAEVQGQYGGGTAVELFTIGDLDDVWVLGDIFEMDLAQVKVGARAVVKVVAYPNKSYPGKVDWVSGSLDPTSHTAKVRCTIDNRDHELKPEMFATVVVYTAEHKALAIPRSALIRLGDQNLVFVQIGPAPDGKLAFEREPVAVNEDEGGEFLPVTHGLARGARVVTSGAILLSGML